MAISLTPRCGGDPIKPTFSRSRRRVQTCSAMMHSWIIVVWLQAGREILRLLNRERTLMEGNQSFDSFLAYPAPFFIVPNAAMTAIVEVRRPRPAYNIKHPFPAKWSVRSECGR